MKKPIYENENFRQIAYSTAFMALTAYRASLKTKLVAADMARSALKKMKNSGDRTPVVIQTDAVREKENNMKHLLSAVAGVATAAALLGAAGYVAHRYVTKKKEDEYENLMYTDEMGEDFIIYEDEEDEEIKDTDKYADAAADVKDTVVSAAENVKNTVADAFHDVKEAIDSVME